MRAKEGGLVERKKEVSDLQDRLRTGESATVLSFVQQIQFRTR